MWSMTLSSQLILPWSTRMASAAAVNALPVEPVGKIVSASTGRGAPRSRDAEAAGERRAGRSRRSRSSTPGTPSVWRRLSTRSVEAGRRSGQRGGRQQRASSASRRAVEAPERCGRHAHLRSERSDAARQIAPDADRRERQDEDGEHEVGERAIAVGDQGDEAEAAGQEHAADQQHERDGQPRAVGERARRGGAARRWSIRSLIAWTALAPLSSRAEKIISWNSRWNSGRFIRCSRKSDGSGRVGDLGIEGDHRDEEEQRRAASPAGPRSAPGDHRVAAAGQVADDRQDHDRADDVVAGIGDAAERPARRPARRARSRPRSGRRSW